MDKYIWDWTNGNVDKGFNLYIDVHPACNADCHFCIAPSVDRRAGDGFWEGVDFALTFTKSVNGTIQIVGGEPLISKRLPQLLSGVGRIDSRRTVLNTNGSFWRNELFSELSDNGVTHVNVSRHHHNSILNQEIMRIKPEVSDVKLRRDIDLLWSKGISVRLQTNLIPGYIDSFDQINDYLEWFSDMPLAAVSFSQLFPLGLFDYNVPPVDGYTEQNQIDLEKVVRALDDVFIPVAGPVDTTLHGGGSGTAWSSVKRRYWLSDRDLLISVKTLSGYYSNGMPRPTQYDKASDPELQETICFAVVHADGIVTASWDKRERVMFVPESVLQFSP